MIRGYSAIEQMAPYGAEYAPRQLTCRGHAKHCIIHIGKATSGRREEQYLQFSGKNAEETKENLHSTVGQRREVCANLCVREGETP